MPTRIYSFSEDPILGTTSSFLAYAAWGLAGFLWLAIAAFVALREDSVDKPPRVPQLYGYTVCLIALIVFLSSLSSIVNAFFERANPLRSEYGFGIVLGSFEAYKASPRSVSSGFDRDRSPAPDTASDATLQKRYDALVEDRMASTRYRTSKTLVSSALFLVLSFLLFGFHWRWVRRLNGHGV